MKIAKIEVRKNKTNKVLCLLQIGGVCSKLVNQLSSMLVKKGQNNKIKYVHIKSDIKTSSRICRSRYLKIHQDLYICIKIRICTSRFAYVHPYQHNEVAIDTSRSVVVYICQDP